MNFWKDGKFDRNQHSMKMRVRMELDIHSMAAGIQVLILARWEACAYMQTSSHSSLYGIDIG